MNTRPQSICTRLLAATFVVAFLLTTTNAQQPVQEKKFTFDKADTVLLAGFALDAGSSWGKREANPLWRDASGMFSPGKNLVFKASLFGGFKLLEWKYPDGRSRRLIRYVKYGAGVAFSALAIRNFTVK